MADAMKLLPCPFCGENPSDVIQNGHIENREEGGYFKFVWCENCDAKSAERKTEAEAAEAWNRRASPPAREEAPADPCASHKAEGFSLDPCCTHCEAPAEGAGLLEWISETACGVEARKAAVALRMIEDRVNAALRNRTSVPEAGAVAWFRQSKQNPKAWYQIDDDERANYERSDSRILPLYDPAPATADKLRVAVEALEPFAAASLDRESQNAKTLPGGASVRVTLAQCRKARQALAALNEPPQ